MRLSELFRGARGLEWMLLAICAVLALLLLLRGGGTEALRAAECTQSSQRAGRRGGGNRFCPPRQSREQQRQGNEQFREPRKYHSHNRIHPFRPTAALFPICRGPRQEKRPFSRAFFLLL